MKKRTQILIVGYLFILGILFPKEGRAFPKVNKTDTVFQTLSLDAKGQLIINTTEIGKNIYGYEDIVPLKIYIKQGKIIDIETLPNDETPEYMDDVIGILDKWIGLDLKSARELEVDAITGATYTSNAIIENVHIALDYFFSHKKEVKSLQKVKQK